MTENETSVVMLGPRDRLIGELYIEGNLRVSGTLEGQIEATGDVDVTEAATVKATVAGREVNVSGQVNGAVTASKKLVIGRSGSIVGDVRVPRLIMQDGASLSGNVSMGPKVAAEMAQAAATAETAAPVEVAAVVVQSAADGETAQEKSKPKKR
ncbi:MAG TPA: polymer-forming cytoskeletal protein [Candidatus Dormibacteraeota bacterium]|nr:polymer-forming cytoskeletal protein [Candidatus Dormibacteraeota bacterium]